MRDGWPSLVPDELKPYWINKNNVPGLPSSLKTSTPNSAESTPLPVVISKNPNTPSRIEGQGSTTPAPSSSLMDPSRVPQPITTEAPTPQRRYPARN